MQLEFRKANIANIVADAVVLPANEKLKEGSGLSAALFKAAGRAELTKACKEIGYCEEGNAVPTPAFNLNAHYIIHSVVPKWKDGKHGEYDLLSSAYLSALSAADIMECESIAFPLLASGNNGFDKELALHIANESIESFDGNHLKKVIIVIYDEKSEMLVKSQGYSVVIQTEMEKEEAIRAFKKRLADKLLVVGMEVAQQFIEDQIEKAKKWLSKPENREKVVKFAMKIVFTVISKGKKSKN